MLLEAQDRRTFFLFGDAARNRESSGSGLGLAICRSIVEAHGGEITAAHSPLGGVWIRVSLPLRTASAGDQP